MKKQRGGTLLGLVIGGLLGLGIALTVAVYVTKVPVPFMNKNASRPSESDAVEARKNKDWNPNAPLAGKNPARATPSVSGELSAPPEPEPSFSVSEPAPEMPKKPERTAKTPKPQTTAEAPTRVPETDADPAPVAATKPVRPQPPLSGDPLGDLAKSRSESTPPSSGADPFNYFIQAGAYRTQEDADQQRARLVLLGMQAKVTEREQAGRTVYRVRVGPFSKKDDADKVKDRLDDNSIETALVRVQR